MTQWFLTLPNIKVTIVGVLSYTFTTFQNIQFKITTSTLIGQRTMLLFNPIKQDIIGFLAIIFLVTVIIQHLIKYLSYHLYLQNIEYTGVVYQWYFSWILMVERWDPASR